MKSNQRAVQGLPRDDEAVSPVIAVILMVAITVVLAATVYVWVSGFGAQGEQAPAASFKVTNCDPTATAEPFTVKLISSGSGLTIADLNFVVTNQGDGSSAGTSWTTNSTGTWNVGNSIQVIDTAYGTDNLASGTTYVIDIVHTPSGNIIGSPQYTC